MRYLVAYWENGDAVTRESAQKTDDVLWVIVQHNGYTHNLGGADTYWVDPNSNTFGILYDNDDPPKAWKWTKNGSTSIKPVVPDTAKVFRGVYISDDDWGRVRYAN